MLIRKLISCNPHGGIFEILSVSFQSRILQDPTFTYVQK